MNPFAHYEHKPQLVEAVLATVVGIVVIRREGLRAGPASVAAIGGLAWGLVGMLDYVVYAFGYQLAQWTRQDTDAIGVGLEWVRVPILAITVIALGVLVARRPLRATDGR